MGTSDSVSIRYFLKKNKVVVFASHAGFSPLLNKSKQTQVMGAPFPRALLYTV